MFRDVSVVEIREVLRAWLAGHGLRVVASQAGVDRKTARRYVEAAVAAGLDRAGGVDQLDDELIGAVVAVVRPDRPQGFGSAWEVLCANHDRINTWVDDGLTVVKIGDLLARQGVMVPQRTLHRYCADRTSYQGRRRAGTVPVVDGEPGVECQIDFARMGMLWDPVTGRRRVVHALIFTAVYSRHMFVWLTFSQTLTAVIDGCEAAWTFFGVNSNSPRCSTPCQIGSRWPANNTSPTQHSLNWSSPTKPPAATPAQQPDEPALRDWIPSCASTPGTSPPPCATTGPCGPT
jgi:hypothetical protein